jgi:hypothetical protein
MLMLHIKDLMLDIRFQQSFNPKSEWAPLLTWS